MKRFNTTKFAFLSCSLSAVTAALLMSACASKPTAAVVVTKSTLSKVGEGEGIHLSEAIKNNLQQDKSNANRERLIMEIVRAYTGRKKQRLSTVEYESCQKKYDNAIECVFLKPAWSDSWLYSEDEADFTLTHPGKKSEEPRHISSKKRHSKVVDMIAKNLKSGNIEKAKDQHEGDYYRAFKRFSEWTPELQSLSVKLLGDKACADPELYNYLGMKAETFFPSSEMLMTATKLYTKVDECAQATPALALSKYVQNSRFRLGLLSVMQNDCATADAVFTKLSKAVVSDYSSRAFYWKAFCAKSDSKKQVEYLSNYEELFKMNPLGFHTLSMNHGMSPLSDNLLKPIDPIIQLRAKKNGALNLSLNAWIGVLEDLDHMGETGVVRKLLLPIKNNPEYLNNLEPGVRLYLSSFAFRAKDTISLFRILDSVFRTQSEYVVDSTMKLFYPIKHLDIIESEVKRVNPFLITALVRQESAFQEEAHSRVGAVGLMQLMPSTARLMKRGVTRTQLFRAETNLKIGIKYYEMLVERYKGDVELALAAYNAGPEVVDQWQKRYPMKNKLLFLDLIPYSETRNYVALIGRNYFWYSKLYADQLKGTGIAQTTPMVFEALVQ